MAYFDMSGSLKDLAKTSEQGTLMNVVGAIRDGGSFGDLDFVDVSPGHVWRTQPAVRKVVSFIARNVASLSWKAYERRGDSDRVRRADSPAELMFRQPRRFQTGYSLLERVVIDMLLYDTALIVVFDDKPSRVSPSLIRSVSDQLGNITRLGIQTPTGIAPVDESVPAAFSTGWSSHSTGGISPLETIRGILTEQERAVKWRTEKWREAPKLNGIIRRPADAPKWDQTARQRWIESWKTFRDTNAGGTPLFEDGMDYQDLSSKLSPAEAKDIEGRQLTDIEVASFFHVPPELVGAREGTFSNIKAFRQMLYGPVLGPIIMNLEQALNAEIVPALAGGDDSIYGTFDRESAMAGSALEQVQYLQSAVGGPYMTRAEARKIQDLGFIPGTEELITPLNVTEGGLASPRDTGAQNLRADAEKRFVAKSAVSDVDKERLERDLKALYRRQAKTDPESVGAWHDEWDQIVTRILQPHMLEAASKGAVNVLRPADGDQWDPESIRAYIRAAAEGKAQRLNDGSYRAFTDGERDHDEALKWLVDVAAGAWAAATVADAEGFGSQDAASQSGAASKTWRTTSSNPRPSHAALNGETVSMDGRFSNGARWPGDGPNLDVDELAGCTCVLEYGW